MGLLRSVHRTHINGHEVDVNCEFTFENTELRLYVDGTQVDMKPMGILSMRQVLSTNLDGSKLEVQFRLRWLSKADQWAIWRGQSYRFAEIE